MQIAFVALELRNFYFFSGYVVDTIRVLRLKQKNIKLDHYNHFVYTIIAALLGMGACRHVVNLLFSQQYCSAE